MKNENYKHQALVLTAMEARGWVIMLSPTRLSAEALTPTAIKFSEYVELYFRKKKIDIKQLRIIETPYPPA
jgi:hypothetical protein